MIVKVVQSLVAALVHELQLLLAHFWDAVFLVGQQEVFFITEQTSREEGALLKW